MSEHLFIGGPKNRQVDRPKLSTVAVPDGTGKNAPVVYYVKQKLPSDGNSKVALIMICTLHMDDLYDPKTRARMYSEAISKGCYYERSFG